MSTAMGTFPGAAQSLSQDRGGAAVEEADWLYAGGLIK